MAVRAADHARWHPSLFESESEEKEECWKGEHVPERAEQGEVRKGGIKEREGEGERFLWCIFPRGQRGGEGLLP